MQKITDNVYSVGATDIECRSFHGFHTANGVTYNSYLIMDDKITLVDTVKRPFVNDLIDNIRKITDPAKIRYIICNHSEPDHAGALPDILALCPDATVIAAAGNGEKYIKNNFGIDRVLPVKSGETLELGKLSLQFIATPMLHWPDNMVTYCPQQKLLFSNDAFGQHYASQDIFDTNNDVEEVFRELRKYYANILLPFSPILKNALPKVAALPIDIIAPSHGVIFTKHLQRAINCYTDWASNKKDGSCCVIYDTMWGETARIADCIASAFSSCGVRTKQFPLSQCHISDIMADVMCAEYICVGCGTYNNGVTPVTAAFLRAFSGLKPAGMKFIAFGSYGWSGESSDVIYDSLAAQKLEPLLPSVKYNFMPKPHELYGLSEKIKDSIKKQ